MSSWFKSAQEKSKAASTKTEPTSAKRPVGKPRKDHHWDGKHALVEVGGLRHYVGAWVPDTDIDADSGAAPAAKKYKKVRAFVVAWLIIVPWLVVIYIMYFLEISRNFPGGLGQTKY
jgi:hypothetical protein